MKEKIILIKDKILIKISNSLFKMVTTSKMLSTRISQFSDYLKAKDADTNDMAYYMIDNSVHIFDLNDEDLCLLHLSLENTTSRSEVRNKLREQVNHCIAGIRFEERMPLMMKVYNSTYNK